MNVGRLWRDLQYFSDGFFGWYADNSWIFDLGREIYFGMGVCFSPQDNVMGFKEVNV